MPTKNIYYATVVHALVAEGWTIMLYMAVPRHVFKSLLTEKFGQLIVARLQLRLLVFDEKKGEIVQWIN